MSINQSINQSIKIYQIFYNEETKNKLDPLFLPCDNTLNPKPEWFEFYPIKNFLDHNELEDNVYYGFLSPKFREKTGLSGQDVIEIISSKMNDNIDVFLSDVGFRALFYYRNVFEHGDAAHPNLLRLSQGFFDHIKLPVNLNNLISTTKNFAFSNYIIAKKSYWLEWKEIADKFYEFVEHYQNELADKIRKDTRYYNNHHTAPMRTFIQERFPAVILSTNKYKTYYFGNMHNQSNNESITKLKLCNEFKNRYLETNDPINLVVYSKIRETIK